MSTRVEVINAAMIKLGQATIADPAQQTENARVASLVFDRLARAEMRGQAWSFAIKRVSIPINDLAPVYGYTYARQLPADFLRMVTWGDAYVFTTDGQTVPDDLPYSIEGQTVVDNETGAVYIRYVADMTANISVWDATFVEAFACRLAMELCVTITKSITKKNDLRADYKVAIREAKRCNSIELPPSGQPDGTWTTARFDGAGGGRWG